MIPKIALLVLICATLIGCGHTPVWHSPSTVPLEANSYKVLGNAEGQDCLWALFGIIPVSNSNDTHQAIANAIASKPGADALVNVTADSFAQSYIIVTKICTRIDGTAVATK